MPDHNPPAGLLRRLAAGVYDGLLVLALLLIPTSVVMAIRGGAPVPPGDVWFQLLLLATAGAFFTWFWTHGGQTLGMRAWRLRVETAAGQTLTARTALLRFGVGIVSLAAFGLGVLWIVVDPGKCAWHDRAAGTRVVVLAKVEKTKSARAA
jgi:uncharacterized RDD family membrane protein YckC